MKKKYVSLGIDVGGTEIKYGLVLKENNKYFLINNGTLKTPKNSSLVIKNIFDIYNRLKKIYPKILSVSIGIAGLIDSKKGKILFSPNLNWTNINLKNILMKKIKEPIFINNDANLVTFGIYKYELNSKYENLVCLALGTGVGSGIVINKKIYNGSDGLAGEFGHTTIIPNGKKCNCGNYGCLERYAGGYWFTKLVKEKIKNKKTLIWTFAENKIVNISPKTVFLAAEKNDSLAKNLWDEYGKYLGIAVANIINTFNPQIIVFTGGLSSANKYFLPSLKKEVQKRVFPIVNKKINLLSKTKFYICSNPKNFGVLSAGIFGIESFQ